MSKKTDDAVLAPAVPEGQMRETAEALANLPDHRDTHWDEANVVVGEGSPEPKSKPKAEPEPEPKPTARTAAKKTAAKKTAAKSTDPAGAGAEGTTKKEK